MSSNQSEPLENGFTCAWKCGICVSVCPECAISSCSDLFVIDKAACSGCLICVRTCPAGIIRGELFA